MIGAMKRRWQERRVRRAYRDLLHSPAGRTVLADLLAFTGVLTQDTHVPGDPYTSAYNAGARRVGLRILRLTGVEPRQADEITHAEMSYERDE